MNLKELVNTGLTTTSETRMQVRPIGEDFELASLHVEESRRGRGIGSALVRQLLSDFAAKHGSEKVCTLSSIATVNLTFAAYFRRRI